MVDIGDALALVRERSGMVEHDPAVVHAFIHGARRPAPVLVVGDIDADRSAGRADEHVVFDGVLAPEVVGAMDAAFGGLEGLMTLPTANTAVPIESMRLIRGRFASMAQWSAARARYHEIEARLWDH